MASSYGFLDIQS